jgi:hypothetical protein
MIEVIVTVAAIVIAAVFSAFTYWRVKQESCDGKCHLR